MPTPLTPTAAKELGRSLRFIRHARSLSLRDVAAKAQLSPQYVQNIERGDRVSVNEEAYLRIGRGLTLPDNVIKDLLLRARVQAALEQRGLDPEHVTFVWRGVEQRLEEVGLSLRTDISKVVVDILA